MMTCETCTFTGSWHESPLLYWPAGTVRTAVPPIWGRHRQNMASFSCKCKGVLQVDGGRAGGGGCSGISLWAPAQILNVVRAENKNSMGARAAKLGSFNRSTFTQTKAPKGFPNPPIPPPPSGPPPTLFLSIYGQDLQPPRIQALEKLVALLTERSLEQWGESLGALGALGAARPAPSEYKRRWWQHVAGIRKFHCGLKSFQRL